MSFPTGSLIFPEELAMFALGSNDSASFMQKLSLAYPQFALDTSAGNQVGNGCLIHIVAIREPIPVQYRKSYSRAKGFDSIVFEQIVAPTIQDPQQCADCKARLGRGDYLVIKPASPDEWGAMFTGSSSSVPPLLNQVSSQTQVIQVQFPMELLEFDDDDEDDGSQQSSKRIQTLRPERDGSFRPQKSATGEIQYRMSVIVFANTGAALFPQTDRQGTDNYWGETIKEIMDHPIFADFIRHEAERLYRQN
ncbi:hypothetical protein BGX34_008193 [Mortierella sp. NVP85]|nr:hypothetical protein BGX34_008193 [Mortierella sp. NVP85]